MYSEQKVSSCTWLLLREFVKQYREKEAQALHVATELGQEPAEVDLPTIPYYKVRQIMTRADFVEREWMSRLRIACFDERFLHLELDHLNIVAIDVSPPLITILREHN